jgi:predicted XRE-type DNA-binding protein
MHLVDLSAAIRDMMKREGLSQAELGERAGVNQSVISRALREEPQRIGGAHARLVQYMQQHAIPGAAQDALVEIWDGSVDHASALAGLIRASNDLWRTD